MVDEKHPLILKWESIGIKVSSVSSTKGQLSISLVVWAKPGSKKQGVGLGADGTLKVAVSARAIDGAANDAIAEFLASKIGISQSSLSLLSGMKSKMKKFLITYVFTDRKDFNYYLSCLDKLFKE